MAAMTDRSIDTARPVPVAVSVWLWAVAFMIFCMVIVGGATRLTDSGLSITEWQPLLGAIPPLNETDWLQAFEKYKLIPEYQVQNHWMTLEDFKFIYWWEWSHRFLGRTIGIVFFVPFLYFVVTRAIPKRCGRGWRSSSCWAGRRVRSAGSWWPPASANGPT